MKATEKISEKKGAIKYIFLLLFQRIIGIGLFFAAAGGFNDIRGIVNVSLYLILSIVACVIMFSGHQETLSERGRKQDNTKKWDKVILPVYVLLAYYGIYIVAGLGNRFYWDRLPIECFYVGTGLYLFSCVFTVWPVIENKHFEATSRIQDNRGQTVIKTGPYKIIRHPGYAGIVLWAIASYLMFGTFPVGIVSFVVTGIIWIRTYLEDKMLKNELAGYLEYSQTVKYRLLPFIW
ncbi:MAG: isoprenylcysteine carboxylmethyltransferase family protein [Tannerellaceae bacterium]|jgi:protein-S-isoprenylcysteine O-methyltransferase Ste14|nr:isoprenylcysteine carboxylmethyltransferase family protein [Tannerellaceae bacterium]